MRTKSGNSTFTTEIIIGDQDVEVEVEFTWSAGYPAKVYAPTEDCYPSEDPSVEIGNVSRNDTGDDLDFDKLPASSQAHIEDQAIEAAIDAQCEAAMEE